MMMMMMVGVRWDKKKEAMQREEKGERANQSFSKSWWSGRPHRDDEQSNDDGNDDDDDDVNDDGDNDDADVDDNDGDDGDDDAVDDDLDRRLVATRQTPGNAFYEDNTAFWPEMIMMMLMMLMVYGGYTNFM